MGARRRLGRDLLSAALTSEGLGVVATVDLITAGDCIDGGDADIFVLDTADSDSARVAGIILEVGRRAPAVPVLALVDNEDDGMLFTSLDAGAAAVVHRDQPLAELASAVRSAADRQSIMSPSLASKVLARVRTAASGMGSRERARLSAREVAVLGGVARGMTNEQIAHETSVSPSTVKNQLYSACRKLGVSSRSHAVAEAIRRGIIAPSGEPILAR